MSSAVLIDLDDTLVDRTGAVRSWLVTQLSPADAAAMVELDGNGYGNRGVFFAALAARLGSPIPAVREHFRAGLLSHLRAMPGATTLLQRLGRRCPIAIATNGTATFQRDKLAVTGLDRLVRQVVISEEIGYAKPHPVFFRHALSLLECIPDAALMVGDHPVNDIAGAHDAGMKTCWLRRAGTPTPAKADACVDHLDEVEAT